LVYIDTIIIRDTVISIGSRSEKKREMKLRIPMDVAYRIP